VLQQRCHRENEAVCLLAAVPVGAVIHDISVILPRSPSLPLEMMIE